MSTDPMAFRREITAQAAQWFATLQQPRVSQTEREEFTQWLGRSVQHIEEYLAISTAWRLSSQAADGQYARQELIRAARNDPQSGTVVPLGFSLNARRPRHTRVRWAWAAAIATVLLAAVLWSALKPTTLEYRTQGERMTLALADGSTVHLNSATHLTITYSRKSRDIRLAEGEAFFQVAKDVRRPFRVFSDRSEIRALGTQFNVQRAPDATIVTVVEGLVEIAPLAGNSKARLASNSPAVRAAPHQQVKVASQGAIVARSSVNADAAAAWTHPTLRFSDEPLGQVIDRFNQYNSTQLVLTDPELAAARVSGVFSSSDPHSFVEYLLRTESVRVVDKGDTVRVIRR